VPACRRYLILPTHSAGLGKFGSAGLRILGLSARDAFATPTIKVHEQYEILPKRFPTLG